MNESTRKRDLLIEETFRGHKIFGKGTFKTLIKFQKANNLPATGYLGPLTRALINAQAH